MKVDEVRRPRQDFATDDVRDPSREPRLVAGERAVQVSCVKFQGLTGSTPQLPERVRVSDGNDEQRSAHRARIELREQVP